MHISQLKKYQSFWGFKVGSTFLANTGNYNYKISRVFCTLSYRIAFQKQALAYISGSSYIGFYMFQPLISSGAVGASEVVFSFILLPVLSSLLSNVLMFGAWTTLSGRLFQQLVTPRLKKLLCRFFSALCLYNFG